MPFWLQIWPRRSINAARFLSRQASFAGAPTARTIASGPRPFLYTKSAKTLARGRARHARFHFLRRDIFDVRADRPLVAERIEKSSGTIAVELIFHRTQDFGSSCDCLF